MLSPTMTKRAKCTVPDIVQSGIISHPGFARSPAAASARPIGDLTLSGMIRIHHALDIVAVPGRRGGTTGQRLSPASVAPSRGHHGP